MRYASKIGAPTAHTALFFKPICLFSKPDDFILQIT